MLARARRFIGRQVDRLVLAAVRWRLGSDENGSFAERLTDELHGFIRRETDRQAADEEQQRTRRLHAVRRGA